MISFCFLQISIFSPFGVLSEQCADLEDYLPDVETTHPPADDYTKFIQKLDKYFLPKKNKDYARFQLGNLQQQEDLSLAKYFAQVQEIAKKYEYHDENDAIRDHLIKTTRNGRIRVKAIRQGWTLLPSRDPQWTRCWRRDQPQSDQNGKEDF